ncbi:MAG: HEAT repeat domain-containing protein [Duganella sp.]
MAITIDKRSKRCISYSEFAEYLTENIDMTDDNSVLEAAESLSAFGNNKEFALELLNKEVAQAALAGQTAFVSHHSLIVGRGVSKRGGRGFAVRMNFWPTLAETSLLKSHRSNVEHTYSYSYPHDHNFTLLTTGIHGPGYETELYERPIDRPLIPGEKAGLKFLEKTRLSEGRVIFFRKSQDVHIQIPPEQLSISLNLLPEQHSDANTEQYCFDVHNDVTTDYILGSGITGRVTLVRTMAEMGIKEAVPVLFDILSGNEVARVRLAALNALIKLAPDDTEYFYSTAGRFDANMVKNASSLSLHGEMHV